MIKIHRILTIAIISILLLSLSAVISVSIQIGLANAQTCPSGLSAPDGDPANCPDSPSGSISGQQDDNGSSGTGALDTDCDVPSGELTAENCKIVEYLVVGINVLSGLAGMAIIASIMIAGFQYMTARDNSGQIQQARTRIIWAITALLLFLFMYAMLNFLVPGGVL